MKLSRVFTSVKDMTIFCSELGTEEYRVKAFLTDEGMLNFRVKWEEVRVVDRINAKKDLLRRGFTFDEQTGQLEGFCSVCKNPMNFDMVERVYICRSC